MFASLGTIECFVLSDWEDSASRHVPFPLIVLTAGNRNTCLRAGGSDPIFPNRGYNYFTASFSWRYHFNCFLRICVVLNVDEDSFGK